MPSTIHRTSPSQAREPKKVSGFQAEGKNHTLKACKGHQEKLHQKPRYPKTRAPGWGPKLDGAKKLLTKQLESSPSHQGHCENRSPRSIHIQRQLCVARLPRMECPSTKSRSHRQKLRLHGAQHHFSESTLQANSSTCKTPWNASHRHRGKQKTKKNIFSLSEKANPHRREYATMFHQLVARLQVRNAKLHELVTQDPLLFYSFIYLF